MAKNGLVVHTLEGLRAINYFNHIEYSIAEVLLCIRRAVTCLIVRPSEVMGLGIENLTTLCIWQVVMQRCCRDACEISKQFEKSKKIPRLRDFKIFCYEIKALQNACRYYAGPKSKLAYLVSSKSHYRFNERHPFPSGILIV